MTLKHPDSPAHPTIHIVSDSTGETASAVVRAALARFEQAIVSQHFWVFVRSDRALDAALDGIARAPGLVFHTLADPEDRARLEQAARDCGAEPVPVLEAHVGVIARHLGQDPRAEAGLQHRVTDSYFDRISALDFAMAQDDGASADRLMKADVILTGVSRTSKTPTCIFLAYRGIRAANVPLVPGRGAPSAFVDAITAGIPAIGLVASPSRLAEIRRHRLEAIGDRAPGYAELDQIREEVSESRLLFQRLGLPVIDVTRRSIEETSAEIQAILRQRAETARPTAADPKTL
ncbi:MAG: pyruvate, water dikinase regulatory protein [Pseudomonadota bacterium]